MKKNYLIIALLVAVAALLLWWMFSGDGNRINVDNMQQAPTEDPLDAVLDFYNPWLAAVQSTTTNPYDAGLATSSELSPEVQQYMADNRENELEPVLCQTVIPERVGAKLLYRNDFDAQVQVLGRGYEEKSPNFAVVTLTAVDSKWQVSEILCQSGESAPEREFSFEHTGYLLKSVPEPLNSEYWHLVFTENNIPGHTAPLFFSESSLCVSEDGTEMVCDESTFNEATEVTVQGEMTESGVDVKRVQL